MTITGARLRMLAGAAIALGFFAIGLADTAIGYFLHPAVRERATAAAAAAIVLYLFVFAGAGALAGYLAGLRLRWLRFVLIGAIAGAVVWSYLNATWPLTARASAFSQPGYGVLEAAFVGAGLGALGGALLVVVIAIGAAVRREH